MTPIDPINPLSIPQANYGLPGVVTGRILYEAARPHGLSMIYRLSTRRITVLHTANFESEALHSIIFTRATRQAYSTWFPHIDTERDSSGNLQIHLTRDRPRGLAKRRLGFEPDEEDQDRRVLPHADSNFTSQNGQRANTIHSLLKTVLGIQEVGDSPLQFVAAAPLDQPRHEQPLHVAISSDQQEVAIELIEAGLDVHALDSQNNTALHLAVERKNLPVIHALLERGANIYAQNNVRQSPLERAKQQGFEPVFAALKDHVFASVLVRGSKLQVERLLAQKVPLTQEEGVALWNKFPELALGSVGDYPQLATFCPFSLIHHFCNQPKDEIINISVLLESGAKLTPEEFLLLCIEFPDVMVEVIKDRPKLAKHCPLQVLDQLFAFPNSEGILLKLFDLGAEVRPKHLYLAIKNNFVGLTVNLLSLKIDVSHALDDNLQPPLILAVRANLDFLVELLIEAKAAVNVQDTLGWTPLHFAAKQGNQAIVHMLIQAGANVLVQNNSSQTPRDLALDSAHVDIAKILFVKSLPEAIESQDEKLVRELLSHDVPLNYNNFVHLCLMLPDLALEIAEQNTDYVKKFTTDVLLALLESPECERLFVKIIEVYETFDSMLNSNMETILHVAANTKRARVVAKLIGLGVDIFAQNKSGQTALHIAARGGSIEIVDLLLKAGAKVSDADIFGWQPLHAAASCGRSNVVERLLEVGADPFYADQNGCTPLALALDCAHFELARLFLRTMPGQLEEKIPLENCDIACTKLQTLVETTPDLARLCCTPTSTPFEIALALGDYRLLSTFMGQLTEKQCIAGVEVLVSKYPHSLSSVINFLFDVDEQHLAFGNLSRMDAGPPAVESNDLDEILKRYKNITSCDENGISPDEVHASTALFLQRVKDEEVFLGTPQHGTPALKEQYRLVRDAITHVLLHLKKSENEAGYDKKVLDICKELAYAGNQCFIQYRATALMLYNKYCLEIAPTAENTLMHHLQQLRGILVEGMTSEVYVNQHQSVHAVQYFKRVLARPLQLVDRALFDQQFPFDGSGFVNFEIPDFEVVSRSFYARYRPSVIFEYIQESLADERIRSLYLDWAKVQLKAYIPGRDEYKAKKVALQQKQDEIIKKMLKDVDSLTNDVLVQYKNELQELAYKLSVESQFNSTFVESAKADMQYAANDWFLDEKTLAPKHLPILLILIKQKVLKFYTELEK